MAFFGRLRDTVASVCRCCFEETDDDDDDDDDMEWYRTPEPAIFQLFEPVATFSMRVIDENEVASTYTSMRKKNKNKFRKSKENEASDSSNETAVCGCAHMNKSINFTAMKKGLQKQEFGQCAGCANEASSSKKTDLVYNDIIKGDTGSDNFMDVSKTTTLWVCLQCGSQGCDRNCQEKHALKHFFETPRSTSHALVINTTTWMVWCYECNDEIPVAQSKRLVECMNHLKKLAGVEVSSVDSLKDNKGSLTQKVMAWISDLYAACFSCKASPAVANQAHNAAGPAASFSVDSSKGSKGSLGQKVMGLRNVGNTCFFNAAMQNLIQTYSLENLLKERSIEGGPLFLPGQQYIGDNSSTSSGDEDDFIMDLPSIKISLSKARPLTTALAYFLQEINSTTQTNIINPSTLFGQVCKEAQMFKGNQQHDSHELLCHLLDIMRSEEIKRGQVGVLKYFKLIVNSNPQTVDHDTRVKVRQYGRQVKHTFVDALFGGCLVSTVMCEECKYISQILEPFLDLSLPVMEEKMTKSKTIDSKENLEDDKDARVLKGIEGAATKEACKYMNKRKRRQAKKLVKRASKTSLNNIIPVEGKKEGEKEEGDREEEEDTKDMKEEKYDADIEDNLENDIIKYNHSRDASMLSDSGLVGSAVDSVELSQSHVHIATHMSLSAPAENTPNPVISLDSGSASKMADHLKNRISTSHGAIKDVSVIYMVMLNGRCIAVEETEDADESKKASPIADGEMYSSDAKCKMPPQLDFSNCANDDLGGQTSFVQPGCSTAADSKDKLKVAVHVEYINGPMANGYLVSGDTSSEEPMELEAAASGSLLSSCNYKQSGIGEQIISDVTSGTNTSSVSETGSSSVSQDSSQNMQRLIIQYQSSEESVKVKDLDVPVNSSHSNVSNDTGTSTQGAGSMDSATVGNNEIPLKTGNGEDVSISFNVQYIKPSVLEDPRPVRSCKEIWREGQRKSVLTLAPRYHSTSHECSLESCLNLFTSSELLTGNNKFGCKNCTKLKYKLNPNKEEIKTVYSNANKKYLIIQPPAVLTLHLKRFEQFEINNVNKLNCHVDFPFVLDLAPYCSALCQNVKPGQKKILYSLYGVVEHSGDLKGGHYTAYVKVRPNIGTLTNFLSTHQVSVKEYLDQYTENVLKMGDTMEEEAVKDNVSEIMVPPGQWFHISDSHVKKVTEATVEHAQAYLLFYERIY